MSCIVCCVALLSGMLRDVIRWCGADCGDQKVAAGLWGVSLKIGWEMLPFPHSTTFSLDPDSHKKDNETLAPLKQQTFGTLSRAV